MGHPAFEIGVADSHTFDISVELGLELVAIVGSEFVYAELELFDDVIAEVDRAGLCVFFVDLERPDTWSHRQWQ